MRKWMKGQGMKEGGRRNEWKKESMKNDRNQWKNKTMKCCNGMAWNGMKWNEGKQWKHEMNETNEMNRMNEID